MSISLLAMRRLSIIGLENGKQPVWNEDKTLVLVYNGEIYNYLQLKEELQGWDMYSRRMLIRK